MTRADLELVAAAEPSIELEEEAEEPSYDAVESGAADFRLRDLPPMPTPHHATKNAEACTGCCVVLSITGLLVALPHSVHATNSQPGNVPLFTSIGGRELGFICLYAEAALAMLCLLGLMFGDPGTLKRSRAVCFPLPREVADRLRNRQTLSHMDNIHVGGQVFCVRCCIWRPDGNPPHYHDATHHCSVCQRCVKHFDHHCGVFGRCIAGKGCGSEAGNMLYFRGILMCAFLGLITAVLTTAVAVGAAGTPGAVG